MCDTKYKIGWICPLCNTIHNPDTKICSCNNTTTTDGQVIYHYRKEGCIKDILKLTGEDVSHIYCSCPKCSPR